MTKDEIKNRISMALKDPILQQGFEIICKENVELKEEIRADNLSIVVLLEQTQNDLLKAQKILKEAQGYIENIDDELYDEIEQFLNSKVEK